MPTGSLLLSRAQNLRISNRELPVHHGPLLLPYARSEFWKCIYRRKGEDQHDHAPDEIDVDAYKKWNRDRYFDLDYWPPGRTTVSKMNGIDVLLKKDFLRHHFWIGY